MSSSVASRWTDGSMHKRVRRRYAAERRFRLLGFAAAERLVSALEQSHALKRSFNLQFLTASDSTDPSAVGVWGALKGTFFTIMVTIALAFPIGVLAAVYLEEFAPRNRWTDAIEVS